MQKRGLLVAALAVLLLPGCLKSTFREEEPRLDLEKSEVSMKAKSGLGAVTDTVQVTSNRSWTVAVSEETEGDWLSVETEGFENPSGVLKTAPLVIVCEENLTLDERRGGIVITSEGQKKTVTVIQRGLQQVGDVDVNGIDPRSFEDYGTV